MDQRAVLRFCTLRLRSKKEYPEGAPCCGKTIFASISRPRYLKPPKPPPPHFSNTYEEVLPQDILSLTLTLGYKNEKQPYGPIELDLEVGNLVFFLNLPKITAKTKEYTDFDEINRSIIVKVE